MKPWILDQVTQVRCILVGDSPGGVGVGCLRGQAMRIALCVVNLDKDAVVFSGGLTGFKGGRGARGG